MHYIKCKKWLHLKINHFSLRVGFEPTREDPIGFQVQRLNHSAIAAWKSVSMGSREIYIFEDNHEIEHTYCLLVFFRLISNPLCRSVGLVV